MKTTTSTLKIGCSNAPVAERNACARTLPAPLQLATEADHKLGFGYSLDAEFAGRGCDAIGRGPLPPTDPTPRACRKETPLPQCRFLESVKRWASGVATRSAIDGAA